MAKANLPTDHKAQQALIKELLSGTKDVEDLYEDTMTINMCLHPTDEQRAAFASNRALQDAWKGDPATTYITIDLS